MWDDPRKIITDREEVINYINETVYNFCNYQLAGFDYCKKSLKITIEERLRNSKPTDEAIRVWEVDFNGVSNIEINLYLVIPAVIVELEIEEKSVVINTESGDVIFDLKGIKIDAPQNLD